MTNMNLPAVVTPPYIYQWASIGMLWAPNSYSEMALCIASQIFSFYNGALLRLLQYIMVRNNSV